MTPAPTGPNAAQIPSIRSAIKFFRVTSYITGVVLLLVMILWAVRRGFGYELMALTDQGFITLEPFTSGPDGEITGLPAGISLTTAKKIRAWSGLPCWPRVGECTDSDRPLPVDCTDGTVSIARAGARWRSKSEGGGKARGEREAPCGWAGRAAGLTED
jgi:hypothetical protein